MQGTTNWLVVQCKFSNMAVYRLQQKLTREAEALKVGVRTPRPDVSCDCSTHAGIAASITIGDDPNVTREEQHRRLGVTGRFWRHILVSSMREKQRTEGLLENLIERTPNYLPVPREISFIDNWIYIDARNLRGKEALSAPRFTRRLPPMAHARSRRYWH